MTNVKKILILSVFLISAFAVKSGDTNKNDSGRIFTTLFFNLASSAATAAGPLLITALFQLCERKNGATASVETKPKAQPKVQPKDAIELHDERVFRRRELGKSNKKSAPIRDRNKAELLAAAATFRKLNPKNHSEIIAAKKNADSVHTWQYYILAKAAELMHRR